MTLEEKVGQMLIIAIPNRSMNEKLKQELDLIKPCGIILMNNNYSSYETTLNLIKDLKNNSKIPLIIATDQEGGIVQRLQKINTKVAYIPSMKNIGKENDETLTKKIGKIIAQQLRTLEINLTFAPVIDVLTNSRNITIGDRAFSSDKEIVSKLGIAISKGIEENGVNTCFKHFPGHGHTRVDSHYALPIVNKTKEELNNLEIIPFKKAIKEDAKMIMIAHIAYPKITNNNLPASLSKEIINDYLKEELGFKGIVVTDALNMGAIVEKYTTKEIAVKTINAGIDILVFPSDNKKMHSEIVNAVQTNEIDENIINDSVRKILRYKYDNIEPIYNSNYLDKSYLNKPEYNEILNNFK